MPTTVFHFRKWQKVLCKKLAVCCNANRPGGYTRIIKLGIRPGDNAEKAMIELVDFNDVYGKHVVAATAESTEPVKKTRRAGKKKIEATTEETTEEAGAEVEIK